MGGVREKNQLFSRQIVNPQIKSPAAIDLNQNAMVVAAIAASRATTSTAS